MYLFASECRCATCNAYLNISLLQIEEDIALKSGHNTGIFQKDKGMSLDEVRNCGRSE